MASLRELNQRRVDRMGGKGLYEGANEGVVNTLRDAIGAPVSPRKSEGVVAPTPPTSAVGAIQSTPVTQQAPQASALGPSAVNLPKKPYDTGFDITPRQGLRREAFGPTIANQGATSMDRLANLGYTRRDVQGAPGVSRLTGADGRTIYTNNLEDTADWVQGGMRGGTVNILPARSSAFTATTAALSPEQARAQLEAAGIRPTGRRIQDLINSADTRNQLNQAHEDGRRRMDLEREKFEFDKQPKPLSEIDKLRLAEAQYGLRERIADRARKELEGRGLTPDQQNRVLENVGESLVATDPARMQTELAKHLPTLRATDMANQYNIGGVTSTGDVTPVGLRGYRLSEVDLFGNDDPNAPTFSEYLWNLGNDKAIVEDSAGGADGKPVRLINAARVKASGDGKNIDLLRRLGIK